MSREARRTGKVWEVSLEASGASTGGPPGTEGLAGHRGISLSCDFGQVHSIPGPWFPHL